MFGDHVHDALPSATSGVGEVSIPFDLDQVVQNLRLEYYAGFVKEDETQFAPRPAIRNLYYLARPFMPVGFRKILQRMRLRQGITNPFPHWPVDRTVDCLFERLMCLAIQSGGNSPIPFIWFWPDGAQAALALTHDVEAQAGRDFCDQLMDLDDSFGFKSAFQVVPETRYEVSEAFLERFRERGFELNVHDLNHDGHLFRKRDEFLLRAKKINEYAKQFQASGFRSGVLYRNLRWYDAFDFSYDMSVPNVGHLDPQGGGCCTLFPYLVNNVMEIPVTVIQDYSLFHILNTYSIDLWKEQCQLILNGHGLINFIVHPDYVQAERAQETYRQLLSYLRDIREKDNIWSALPREIDRWWRMRREMKLVREGERWLVEGEGKERARVAYAHLIDCRLVYSFNATFPEQTPSRSVNVSPSVAAPAMALSSTSQAAGSQDSAAIGNAVWERPNTSPSSHSPSLPAAPVSRRPLRVGMISYSFYENDNRVMRYAETLAQRGDYVEVFALRRDERPREEIMQGVHVHRIQSRKINEKNRFSYLGRIVQFLFRAMYHLTKNQLHKKYDLLHIHSVPDFLVFAGWLPRLSGTPVILDIHDILPEFYASKFDSAGKSIPFRLLEGVEKISTAFSSHVIIANHIWEERLLSRSVRAGKCSVVLNSPDRSIFHQNGRVRNSTDRFVLMYPGTLNWHQGLDLAIRAFGKIKDQVPHADFQIYGDGPVRGELENLIRDLHLENRVFLLKPLPLREVSKAIGLADLGIVPKRKDNFGNEAFSTKILEFMAMGVPVIVADTKIDRYYFDDSVVCFFRGGEEEDLANRMLYMIQNEEKRKLLAMNATRYVEKVDWNAKQHEYLELVDQLVSKHHHSN